MPSTMSRDFQKRNIRHGDMLTCDHVDMLNRPRDGSGQTRLGSGRVGPLGLPGKPRAETPPVGLGWLGKPNPPRSPPGCNDPVGS
jgi:hypothetical protein